MPFEDTVQSDACRYRPVPVAYYTSRWWFWQELFTSDRGLRGGYTTLFRLFSHLMCVNQQQELRQNGTHTVRYAKMA